MGRHFSSSRVAKIWSFHVGASVRPSKGFFQQIRTVLLSTQELSEMSGRGFAALKRLSDRKVSFQARFVGSAKSEVPECNFCPGRVSPVLSWIPRGACSAQSARESKKDIFDTTPFLPPLLRSGPPGRCRRQVIAS